MWQFLFGDVRRDPEGYRVNVGSVFARMFLRKRWAIVLGQTTWLRTNADWESYINDPHWRAHEHHHYFQERVYFRGLTPIYMFAFLWQYIRFGGHDAAPLEIEAESAARDYMASLRSTGVKERYLRSNGPTDPDLDGTDSTACC